MTGTAVPSSVPLFTRCQLLVRLPILTNRQPVFPTLATLSSKNKEFFEILLEVANLIKTFRNGNSSKSLLANLAFKIVLSNGCRTTSWASSVFHYSPGCVHDPYRSGGKTCNHFHGVRSTKTWYVRRKFHPTGMSSTPMASSTTTNLVSSS